MHIYRLVLYVADLVKVVLDHHKSKTIRDRSALLHILVPYAAATTLGDRAGLQEGSRDSPEYGDSGKESSRAAKPTMCSRTTAMNTD